ncbi:unnamed protein product [Didymodactylos carnosus]|uniref:Uncharacterized protein n=1 Tax=Didymodactylos carnosus TaxID=1234261 RepID=A0A815BUE4_9BILA|nr:unnamed protein product [Didymodactylos carnosus]CAF1274303.1 unnamed protein product [Didymodactylos carnosus]CAF3734461.1 unnamed protein product [Didymodactylos carnosus]CAF4064659.1 unnamed protein product [Didymodactylos carnosus]
MTIHQRAPYRRISDLEIEVITGLYNQGIKHSKNIVQKLITVNYGEITDHYVASTATSRGRRVNDVLEKAGKKVSAARLSDPQCLIQQRGDALDCVLLHRISSDPLPNPTPPLAQSTTNFESVDDDCLLSIPSFMSNFRDEPPPSLPFKYEDLEPTSVHAQYDDIIVETLKVITTLPLRTKKGIDTNTLSAGIKLAPLPKTKFSPPTTAPSLSLERVEQSTIIRPRTNLNHSQTTRIPKKGPQKRTIEITDIDDKYEIENVSPPSKKRRLPPSLRVNSLISRIEDVLKPFESYAEQNIIPFIDIADEDDTNNNERNLTFSFFCLGLTVE